MSMLLSVCPGICMWTVGLGRRAAWSLTPCLRPPLPRRSTCTLLTWKACGRRDGAWGPTEPSRPTTSASSSSWTSAETLWPGTYVKSALTFTGSMGSLWWCFIKNFGSLFKSCLCKGIGRLCPILTGRNCVDYMKDMSYHMQIFWFDNTIILFRISFMKLNWAQKSPTLVIHQWLVYRSPPSGAEDKHGYIWDRHYNICLARLQHDDVVNSVAFSPADQELLLSASDDSTIKVWRSPRMVRLAQTPAHPPRPRSLLSWLGRNKKTTSVNGKP